MTTGSHSRQRRSWLGHAGVASLWCWLPHMPMTLDWFSSQRRPLTDLLDIEPNLLASAVEGRCFGDLAKSSAYPPGARAHLLHQLWHRRLGLERDPLGARSWIVAGAAQS